MKGEVLSYYPKIYFEMKGEATNSPLKISTGAYGQHSLRYPLQFLQLRARFNRVIGPGFK